VDSNTKRFVSIGETFNSIKVVKSLQKEDLFINNFKSPSINYSKTVASHQTINEIPNTIVETVILVNVILSALFIIYINHSNSNNSDVLNYLPTLGLFIYAFYRVKPYLQSMYSGISGLKYGIVSIDNLHKEFLLIESSFQNIQEARTPIIFNDIITLENISYSYPGSNNIVLKNLSLKIKKGNMVGFVGSTGAGKTTLIDILLGLLYPISGRMLVDKQLLTKNEFSSFRKQIGYVPQDIYMMDTTIAKNIAFCFDTEDIDFERIIYCAKLAQIDEFIQSLPLKYETNIGERGIQISGGQRQRIGIARALYLDAPILLLDEATSALDNITERELMNSINQLAPKKTIILIAHRITTLNKCDEIFVIEKGSIVDNGTYDFLKATSIKFKNMLNDDNN
jgi:ABC-type multidrug transport system fused ATPase/permease subunit